MSVSLIVKNTKTVIAAGGNACAYMIITGLLTSCLLNIPEAQAGDTLRLKMSSGEVLRVGEVNDGTRITQGHIVTRESHTGFQVRSNALKSGNQPNRYILTGIQNSANTLRVRLEGNGWHPDNTGGQGIVLNTVDDIAAFDVVTDGGQKLVADRYRLEIQGNTIAGNDNSEQANTLNIQSVDINVGEISTVTHTLTAVTGLRAGKTNDGLIIANGTVLTTDGTAQKLALRFTPAVGVQGTATNTRIYSGKSDQKHPLRVIWEADDVSDTKVEDWWITPPKARIAYKIRTDGPQNIAADTYTVSIDAAIWTE